MDCLYGFFDELEKIAEEDNSNHSIMRKVVSARPWVGSAIKGAIPSAVVTNLLVPMENSKAKRLLVAGSGLVGGAASVGDQYIKRWAQKHPRHRIAKTLQEQASAQTPGAGALQEQSKMAAMAGDLRRNGIGGVKRPPMPTEDSKRHAMQQFKNTTKPGKFTSMAKARNLVGPGPSVHQVATLPTR